MLVVITSDSHGRTTALKEIAAKHMKARLYLDAGDSESDDTAIYPFLTVRGNRDRLADNRYRIVEMEGWRFFIFHGDRSSLDNEYLANLAKNNNCQFIIHGHTHVPYHVIHQGIHIINPGSITYPRSSKGATYALVNIKGEEVKVEFRKAKE